MKRKMNSGNAEIRNICAQQEIYPKVRAFCTYLQVGRKLVSDHEVPELLVEGATVGHEGGTQRAVPDQAPLQVRRLFAVLGPTRALSRKAADEGGRLCVSHDAR